MGEAGRWVLRAYRVPREPSRPRIAVWRALERLGVARLGDGLVALPADARAREQLEWVAEEVTDHGGTATLWLATCASATQQDEVVAQLRAARAAEYQAVVDQARAAEPVTAADRLRLVRRLRADLGRIAARDYFPPPQREAAQLAVQRLAGVLLGRSPAGDL